jgi:TPR repeat protein
MPAQTALLLTLLLATAPALAQDTVADEATRAAVQRFRSAKDPADARRAFEELRARSSTSPQAALACGVLAARPGSVAADRAKAIECLRRGADAGSAEARHQLARLLLDSPGGAGRAEAEKLLAQSAGALPESVYLLAKLRAERAADPVAAGRATVEQAAKAGYAPAQRELAGLLLQDGKRDEAMGWLEKASAQGDAEAAYELATALTARHEARDVARIVELLQFASARGLPRASYALGMRYLRADGVKRDTERAFQLVSAAAMAGELEAQYAAGFMIGQGLGTPGDDAAALAWLRRAADRGHAEAAFGVGNYYANGWGVGKSMDLAYRWYCTAAQRGHARARELVRGSSAGCAFDDAAGHDPKAAAGAPPR